MTVDEVNALPGPAFVARFGGLFEHSPWVVERAAMLRPLSDVHAGLMRAVSEAHADEQLALIRAHPELAGKVAVAGELTEASAAEQAAAGLDRLTAQEFAQFHALNAAYRARFGFPFIICVRLTDKAGILGAMQDRLGNDGDSERRYALEEIGKIVRLRLEDLP